MMIKTYCDCCGSEIVGQGVNLKYSIGYLQNINYDLCAICAEKAGYRKPDAEARVTKTVENELFEALCKINEMVSQRINGQDGGKQNE